MERKEKVKRKQKYKLTHRDVVCLRAQRPNGQQRRDPPLVVDAPVLVGLHGSGTRFAPVSALSRSDASSAADAAGDRAAEA